MVSRGITSRKIYGVVKRKAEIKKPSNYVRLVDIYRKKQMSGQNDESTPNWYDGQKNDDDDERMEK